MRTIHLSRVDIRMIPDRSTGALTLRYVGRKLRFLDRPYGYTEGTFFVVDLAEIPLPDTVVALASAVGVDLLTHPIANELRHAVAAVLLSEATMDAPGYFAQIAEPRAEWIASDMKELEHRNLAAENKVVELTKIFESSLRRRIAPPAYAMPPVRTYDPMPPAGFISRLERPAPTPPAPVVVVEKDVVEEEDNGPIETSEATGRRVEAAVRAAREQELPQRLPGGARRALNRLPAGLYLECGSLLKLQSGICSAMVNGAESGKRRGESTVIDWDGEWPVVARRYGSHGRIVYRVEDALRRSGVAFAEGVP